MSAPASPPKSAAGGIKAPGAPHKPRKVSAVRKDRNGNLVDHRNYLITPPADLQKAANEALTLLTAYPHDTLARFRSRVAVEGVFIEDRHQAIKSACNAHTVVANGWNSKVRGNTSADEMRAYQARCRALLDEMNAEVSASDEHNANAHKIADAVVATAIAASNAATIMSSLVAECGGGHTPSSAHSLGDARAPVKVCPRFGPSCRFGETCRH